MNNLDHDEKMLYLTLIMRTICEENNLSKQIVIDDFIYLMNREINKNGIS